MTKTNDSEGRLTTLKRTVSPDPNQFGSHLLTQWTYDAAGRKLTETAPDLAVEHYTYGDNVNLTQTVTRKNETVTAQYDALGRLVQRSVPATTTVDTLGTLSIPADVQTFKYDSSGNMSWVINGSAMVQRQYYPNGSLKSELQRVLVASGDTSNHAHDYLVRYHYDLDGRRDSLFYPWQAVVQMRGGGYPSPLAYHYDASGALSSLTSDVGESLRTFSFYYDGRGRLDSIYYPNSVRDLRAYDNDDRIVNRQVLAPSSTLGWTAYQGSQSDSILAARLTYDPQGRVAAAYTAVRDSIVNGYDGLGHLRWMSNTPALQVSNPEAYQLDPLGNLTLAYHPITTEATDGIHKYDAVTSRIVSISAADTSQAPSSTFRYDAAGNQQHVARARWAQNLSAGFNGPPTIPLTTDAQYAYDALGRLRFVKERSRPHTGTVTMADDSTDEETRYDALARRVWVSSNHMAAANCGSSFLCSVTRFVWDGSQVLAEFRMPDSLAEQDTNLVYTLVPDGPPYPPPPMQQRYSWYWGQVTYTPGLTIDQPLAIYRAGGGADSLSVGSLIMYPHADWRGNLSAVSFGDGSPTWYGNVHYTPPLPTGWNAQLTAYGQTTLGGRVVTSWQGSLIMGQRGESDLMYRRNRYYDPTTGQFTQEDPLGLAGGMNLYGFAGGDPVSYSDPFGLCPTANGDDGKPCPIDNSDGLGWARVAGAMLKPVQRPLEVGGILATAPLTISGEAAMVTLGLAAKSGQAADAMLTFYRGVDATEAADFAEQGTLRASPNGNAGKYLTNTIESATQWAGKNGGQVLRVRVPADATKVFHSLGRIDGIGDAWWAPMDALNGARVDVLKNLVPVPR